ncbi:MAG: hypothetical protein K2X87_26435 [Gemmataceae bacterium]|nr:hypothetical protein [Gemmataceae bacterium]
MRALCGAIITAGAMIAVGLTALGIGTRYQTERFQRDDKTGQYVKDVDGDQSRVRMRDMDRPLVFALVFATSAAVIGLGITVAGLAYHHARREREHQWERERHAAGQRTAV